MIIRWLRKIRRDKFIKTFAEFSKTSGIGSIGCGDRCFIEGRKYIELGEQGWFGVGTELLVYGSKKGIHV